MELRLPIVGKGVTLTELPNEISVFFEVGNCTQHCKGCHSPELWEDKEAIYMDLDEIKRYIQKQRGATAVVFMGGCTNSGVDPNGFLEHIVKPLSTEYPIGLYHGDSFFPYNWSNLTWLKLGRYIEEKGGLDKDTTNQRMYKQVESNHWEDITKEFKK